MIKYNNYVPMEILRNPEKDANIINRHNIGMPFEINWSFGWNSDLGLVSIFEKKEINTLQIFFTNAHVGIVLECNTIDIKMQSMKILTGHQNSISSFDINFDGRWLVTANKGNLKINSMIIIWNALDRTPVTTLCLPLSMGITIIKFSVDSKYLVTVSVNLKNHGEQTIDIWDWTSGAENSKYSTKLDKFDTIIHFTNCYENPNFYCFTTKKRIFFMTIAEKENKLIINVPKLEDKKQSKYNYTQSTYITNFRQVISASTGGLVSIWDDTNYFDLKIKNKSETNSKQFLKNVKLDDYCISTIICHKDNILTGNTNGDVFVYDKTLCVIYHLNRFVGDSVVSIVMVNANEMYNPQEVYPKQNSLNRIENSITVKKKHNMIYNSRSVSASDLCILNRIGTYFTAKQQFKCDPFFISMSNCKIFKVDILQEICVQLFEKSEKHSITAMDVHPNENMIIYGNSVGVLSIYNFQTKVLVTDTTDDILDVKNNCRITCVKYSPNGKIICYGRADGYFRLVDPRNLNHTYGKPFKWGDTSIRHITFNKSSNYLVYTDGSFGIYLYSITDVNDFNIKYFGCTEVHTGIVRSICVTETHTYLKVYTTGADHKIVKYSFDKTLDDPLKLMGVLNIESSSEPVCMATLTNLNKNLRLIISSKDFHLYIWNDSRCIQTTLGVNLDTPITTMKMSSVDWNLIFFCTDTDIGILRQPVDGNPYRNAAILGSGSKLIDIGISWNMNYVFSISENNNSVLMWYYNPRYLNELEAQSHRRLKSYKFLLEGGTNGSEISLLKEYFYSIQLANNSNPVTSILKNSVDICNIGYLMRAMGYYPSEVELSNMMYEIYMRRSKKYENVNIRKMKISFDEFVILYLNYKPQIKLKYDDIRRAFDEMTKVMLNDYEEDKVLTRESFVYMLRNLGSKISFHELDTIIRTLLKSTNYTLTGSNQYLDVIQNALPFKFTFNDILDLFGFQDTTAESTEKQ